MTLQERIKKIEHYFKGMEIVNDTVIVKVLYGNKWGAYPSQDDHIKVAKSEELANQWFYYADYTHTVIDEIFDLIDETIDMNLSAIERLELFNTKNSELRELFVNEPLSKLKTLTFTFHEPKKTKKKKTKKEVDYDKIIDAKLIKNEEINQTPMTTEYEIPIIDCENKLEENNVIL